MSTGAACHFIEKSDGWYLFLQQYPYGEITTMISMVLFAVSQKHFPILTRILPILVAILSSRYQGMYAILRTSVEHAERE